MTKLSELTNEFTYRKFKSKGGLRSKASLSSYEKRYKSIIQPMIKLKGDFDLDSTEKQYNNYAVSLLEFMADMSNKTGEVVMSDIRSAFLQVKNKHEIFLDQFKVPSIEEEVTVIPSDIIREFFQDNLARINQHQMHLYYVLLTLTGARQNDVIGFTSDNFQLDEGNLLITYRQKKTKAKPITIIIKDKVVINALEIPQGKLFSRNYNDLYNDTKKWIAELPYLNKETSKHTTKVSGEQKVEHITVRDLITPHTIRRTFCNLMIDLGVEIPIVMYFSGHSLGKDVFMKHYLKVSDEVKIRSHDLYIKHLMSAENAII